MAGAFAKEEAARRNAAGRLDLQHLGSEVGKDLTREFGALVREVEDAGTCEQGRRHEEQSAGTSRAQRLAARCCGR